DRERRLDPLGLEARDEFRGHAEVGKGRHGWLLAPGSTRGDRGTGWCRPSRTPYSRGDRRDPQSTSTGRSPGTPGDRPMVQGSTVPRGASSSDMSVTWSAGGGSIVCG